MVSEFRVEVRSGGTCVLRVVTGADWEQEFFDDMVKNWTPYFDNLRLYLTHFPGQKVTSMTVGTTVPGPVDAVWSALRQALGGGQVGDPVDVRGVKGQVERISTAPAPNELLVRTSEPAPGFLGLRRPRRRRRRRIDPCLDRGLPVLRRRSRSRRGRKVGVEEARAWAGAD
jgi:hypothetical protein